MHMPKSSNNHIDGKHKEGKHKDGKNTGFKGAAGFSTGVRNSYFADKFKPNSEVISSQSIKIVYY